MHKKAQTLVIILWVLVILAFLAVGIGYRVSTALDFSRYQKDKLKAYCLAKSQLSRAIAAIDRAEMGSDPISEESKININTASEEQLIALLEKAGMPSAQEIAANILIYRGDKEDDQKLYERSGYLPKQDTFNCVEEFALVKGIAKSDFEKLKGYITVYGKGSLDINTASEGVLSIACRGIAKILKVEDSYGDSVAGKIIELRDSAGRFKTRQDIKPSLTGQEEQNIFNKLMEQAALSSDNFLIAVTGNASTIRNKVSCVYNRAEKRVVFWHEN